MTKEFKVTPGKWQVFTIASPDGCSYRIFSTKSDGGSVDIAHIPMAWADNDNAHLLAASKAMYEALYVALPIVEDALLIPEYKKGYIEKCIKLIKDAIAQARGEHDK